MVNEAEYWRAVENYESSLDELAQARDASSADEVDYAVSTLDSATEELLKVVQALAQREVSPDPAGELPELDWNNVAVSLADNKKRTEEAAKEVLARMEETPSDGEEAEEQLDELVSLAIDLYDNLAEFG